MYDFKCLVLRAVVFATLENGIVSSLSTKDDHFRLNAFTEKLVSKMRRGAAYKKAKVVNGKVEYRSDTSLELRQWSNIPYTEK